MKLKVKYKSLKPDKLNLGIKIVTSGKSPKFL